MEPRYSMTAYAMFMVATLLGLAGEGFATAAGILAVGVGIVGAVFDAVYVRRLQPTRSRPSRRSLDKIVRRQLAGIVTAGLALGIGFGLTGFAPFELAPTYARAIIIGAVIAVSTIYASSLVDWYWIMPKVSGAVGAAPCERPGQERWAGVTSIWFFHRAVATSVVIGVLGGVPAYLAGSSHHGGTGTAWALLGTALAVGYSSVNSGVRTAFAFSFNSPIHVGDIIRVRADPEDAELQDAYVVDVSIQGLKYKLIASDPATEPRFVEKGVPLSMEVIAHTRRARIPYAPCENAAECQAINWYCHRNPRANGKTKTDNDTGTPT